jgi:uncharacterized protein YegL
MAEPIGNVLPIYFVADESGSMAGNMGELNAGLRSLLDALHMETMAAAKVRFSILGFADTTVCHLPMTDLRTIDRMPELSARGTTSYMSVFLDLITRLPSDVRALKAAGYRVNRPVVFFLTDGMPNASEEWGGVLEKLSGLNEHPNILAFGIGNAEATTILRVATKPDYAFLAATGTDTGKAVAGFCDTLVQSVVSSGQALANGNAELQGERPEGFRMAVDVL